VKRVSSSLRQNCASVVDCHQPWLKRWMKWGFSAICQRITSWVCLMICF